MSNDFYTPSGTPAQSSQGSSAAQRSEFALIAAGFDKLPDLATPSLLIAVNATSTALEAVSQATAQTILGISGSSFQPVDADLTAYAALATAGLVARTGAGTAATRTITMTGSGIGVANGDGVAGNPTLSLANDLAAVEALATTGGVERTGSETWATFTLTAAGKAILDDADAAAQRVTMAVLATAGTPTQPGPAGVLGASTQASPLDHVHRYQEETIAIACSDETTALTTGTNKAKFRMPYAFTVNSVRASLSTAQASGATLPTIDINENGTTIISTKLTFDNTEKTTTTAATPAVISDSALADDSEITIDIDAIQGASVAAGLKVYLIGRRSS